MKSCEIDVWEEIINQCALLEEKLLTPVAVVISLDCYRHWRKDLIGSELDNTPEFYTSSMDLELYKTQDIDGVKVFGEIIE